MNDEEWEEALRKMWAETENPFFKSSTFYGHSKTNYDDTDYFYNTTKPPTPPPYQPPADQPIEPSQLAQQLLTRYKSRGPGDALRLLAIRTQVKQILDAGQDVAYSFSAYTNSRYERFFLWVSLLAANYDHQRLINTSHRLYLNPQERNFLLNSFQLI